jgi:hypothetical protein
MITGLKRYFARRRLKPVVNDLPRRLMKAFGTGAHCTFPQAKRVISTLRLRKSVEPYAFAAVCPYQEIGKGDFPMSAPDYQRLRTELADLFDLGSADFTIKDLLATPYSTHHPAAENVYASSGPPVRPGGSDS